MSRAQCGRCETWKQMTVDDRFGLMYSRVRCYGRDTSLMRESGSKKRLELKMRDEG